MHKSRIASIASVTVLAGMLAACAAPYYPNQPTSGYPASSYPAAGGYPATTTAPNYVEYGRVSNIEVVQAASAGTNNGTAGTLIGGVVGGLLGNQVGSGGGRSAATVLGAVGGAVVGNQIANRNAGPATGAVYRITVQTDGGQWRAFDVNATGDLRVGDRVRIDNNVLYRS
jgi:outer membrane lipoprotein SlyB